MFEFCEPSGGVGESNVALTHIRPSAVATAMLGSNSVLSSRQRAVTRRAFVWSEVENLPRFDTTTSKVDALSISLVDGLRVMVCSEQR
jgi:hypothetical protein